MRLLTWLFMVILLLSNTSVFAEPLVVGTYPKNGATIVDPKLQYIRIRFSEPVRTGSYSLVNTNQGEPIVITGKPQFDDGNKLCIVPVKLASETTYAVSINNSKYQGFRSADEGTPVTPYLLKFSTAGSSDKVMKEMTPAKWQEDLEYLASELPHKHKNLFFKMTEKEWAGYIQHLKDQIPAMTNSEVMVGLKRLFAPIGDQHTDIDVFQSDQLTALPLIMYWFKDGIYVIGASQEYKNILSCRIVKVDDVDIDKACTAVSTLFCYDNDSGRKKNLPVFLNAPDFMKSLKLILTTDYVSLTLKDGEGKSIVVKIKPVANGTDADMLFARSETVDTIPLHMRNIGQAYWVKYLEKENLVYFQYNQCNDMTDYPFDKMLSALSEILEEHSDARLVIDLRHNTGGSSALLDPFIDSLKNSGDLNRKGRLFVITGRQTFSSAVLNAARLRYETNAIFVGEAATGSPNHFGEVKSFTLPNSKLKVSYSTKYFQYSKEAADSIATDIPVEPTFAEYLNGVDPVLDAIIRYKN